MKKSIGCLMLLSLLLCGCNNHNNDIIDGPEEIKSWIFNFHSQNEVKLSDDKYLEFGEIHTFTDYDKYEDFEVWLNDCAFKSNNSDEIMLLPNTDFSKYKVSVVILYEYIRNSTFELNSVKEKDNQIQVNVSEICNYPYDSVNSYGVVFLTYNKNNDSKIVLNYKDDCSQEITEKKPIIYFYPEQELDLNVRFVNEDKLLTTYPKYNGGWDIHLNKDGTFTTNDNNREYYALYYEAESNYECTFEEGFNVNKDNASTFLEEKMDYIGFNNKEVNEFIMYWLPILENNVNSLVYFEQTEERNEECPLEFSTSPDSLIRVIMHVKKVNKEVNVKEQELKHYERVGFTVTEWGGIEY